MKKVDRTRLHFGPYKTPRFRYGRKVDCEYQGEVTIIGVSNGRIGWPLGRTKERRRQFVICGDLAKALRRETTLAICHWWGVSASAVANWRRKLGIDSQTEGCHKLRSEQAKRNWPKVGPQCHAKMHDPGRLAKLAAARRNWKPPRHVVEAMQKANLGRKFSQSHLAKLRRPRKPSGKPRAPYRPWTKVDDKVVVIHEAVKAAQMLGRSLQSIYTRRHFLRRV